MDSFHSFRDRYKPFLRPEGMGARVCYAMEIDDEFRGTFRYLRRDLLGEINNWPEAIAIELMKFRNLSEKLDHEGMATFRELFEQHKVAILNNRFDEDYFDSIEDVTLFFIFHDIRAVWLVGAIKRVVEASMRRLYDRRDGGRRAIQFALVGFLTLELSQVQRVYIRFAELLAEKNPDPAVPVTLAS